MHYTAEFGATKRSSKIRWLLRSDLSRKLLEICCFWGLGSISKWEANIWGGSAHLNGSGFTAATGMKR